MTLISQLLLYCWMLLHPTTHVSPTQLSPETTLSQACTRASDSLILVQLYQSCKGSNWFNQWILTQPMQNWHGIHLGPNGCVERINLNLNNLDGNLPPDLSLLGSLTRFTAYGNKISGQLPSAFSNFDILEELNLDDNLLSGPLPTGLGSVLSLKSLSLRGNNFNGNIPNTYTFLINLSNLNLSFNALSGSLPADLGDLNRLVILDLSNNQFSGNIPLSYNKLGLVQELYLNNNLLSGEIPSNFTQLTLIKHLWLHDNRLTGNVPNFSNLSLNSLRLENNSLTGIPDLSGMRSFGQNEPFGLRIHGNLFTFEDLIPLQKLPPFYHFSYKPQDTIVYALKPVYIVRGSNVMLKLNIDNSISDNNYKWFRDSSLVFISNSNVYELVNADYADEGNYTARITNLAIPDFEIRVASFRIIIIDENKCNKPIPGTSCQSNVYYCDLSKFQHFCATLPFVDTSNTSSYLCDTSNIADNPRWISFTANSDTMEFEFIPFDCQGITKNGVFYDGIQVAIWEGCGDATLTDALVCSSTCQTEIFSIKANNLVAGRTYYMIVDGCEGSICTYTMRIVGNKTKYSMLTPAPILGEPQYCPDSIMRVYKIDHRVPFALQYMWTINDSIIEQFQDTFIQINHLQAGTHLIKVYAIGTCDTSLASMFSLRVFPEFYYDLRTVDVIGQDSLFVLSFNIVGGTKPFTILEGKGIIDTVNLKFISDPIRCLSNYKVELRDANQCQYMVKGFEACGCVTTAGQMANDTIYACEGQTFVAHYLGGEVRTPEDGHIIIIHSKKNDPVGSAIRQNRNGVFAYDPALYKFDSIYYITYIIGRLMPNGNINFTHPCTSFSNTEAVIFKKKPIVTAGVDKTFCGLAGELNAAGTYLTGKWKFVRGPGTVLFQNIDTDQTYIIVDTFGVYTFAREVLGEFCPNRDEVKITFQGNLEPKVGGDLYVCAGQKTRLDAGQLYAKYQWSTGDSTRLIDVTEADTICLLVTDQNGCTGSTCVVVQETTAPNVEILGQQYICEGDFVNLSSQTDFKFYSWSTGFQQRNLAISKGGNYCLTVTDVTGCTASDCIDVEDRMSTSQTLLDTICFGDFLQIGNRVLRAEGKYTVTLTNGGQNLCDSTVLVSLSVFPEILLFNFNIMHDNGSSNGSISIFPQGGRAPYTYQWSNNKTSSSITNLKAGRYSVTIKDANNCTALFFFDVLLENANEDINISQQIIIHPNPVGLHERAWIQLSEKLANGILRFYHSDGKLCSEQLLSKHDNSSSLYPILLPNASGLYHVTLRMNNGQLLRQKVLVE